MGVAVVPSACAGLDIGKRLVVAAVRTPGEGRTRRCEVRTFGTFAAELKALADWLDAEGVTQVAMEATGVYWKPVWHLLEGRVRAAAGQRPPIKNVPGRKTDVKDAEWIAQLLRVRPAAAQLRARRRRSASCGT